MPRRPEPNAVTLKVGARIRELRTERHFSLADLADLSGMSRGHLSGIEHGLTAITIETIDRIAKGLDLRALDVLTFPLEDERAQTAELIRKLPAADIKRLRRKLTKTVQAAARVQAKAARK
jgi:transcriptional regulator with XRE-family HTH domain